MKELKTKYPKISDIYKPAPGNIIIEATIRSVTETGVHIPEQSRSVDSFAKVVAVADNVEFPGIGDSVLLKHESHEIVPAKRVVILTMKGKDNGSEVYYVQISSGTIMGVVSERFKELAKKSYEKEYDKAKKEHDKPKIIVPDNSIIKV